MNHTQAESPPSSSDKQRPTSSTSEGGRENLEPHTHTHQAREGTGPETRARPSPEVTSGIRCSQDVYRSPASLLGKA